MSYPAPPSATAIETAADRLPAATPDPLLATARQRLRLRTLAAVDQRRAAPGFAPAPDRAIYHDPLDLARLIGTDWSLTLAEDVAAGLLPLRRALLQGQLERPAADPVAAETPPVDLLAALPSDRRAAAVASRQDLPLPPTANRRPPTGPTCLAVAAGLAEALPPPALPDLRPAVTAAIDGLWPTPVADRSNTAVPATARPTLALPKRSPARADGGAWIAWLMPTLSLLGLLLAVVYARLLSASTEHRSESA